MTAARALPLPARLPVGASPEQRVAGTVNVAWREFVARVGRTASAVWAWLCAHRDRDGRTTCTVEDVRRILGGKPTRRTVERTFTRLRLFGLLSDAENVPLTPPGTPYALARWRVTRIVFGSWCPFGSDVCVVPRSVARKLTATAGHGGARPGNPSGKRGGKRAGSGGGKRPPGPPDDERKAAEIALCGSDDFPAVNLHSNRRGSGGQVVGVTLLSTLSSIDHLPSEDDSGGAAFVSELTEGGTLVDGPASVESWEDYPGTVRKPRSPEVATSFASIAAVPDTHVPHPPGLPIGVSDENAIRLLELAYVGAVQVVTKKPCYAFRKTRKYNGRLLAAANALAERGIAPVAWAAFRVDAWHRLASSGNGKFAPPVGWVFSVDAIAKHWAWCVSAGFTTLGGRRVYGPRSQEYVARALAQERAFFLMPRAERTPARVRALAESIFSVEERGQLLRAAQDEAAMMQANLRARAANGDWIW